MSIKTESMAKSNGLKGDKNGNWKGGRTISKSGYVLIRVGQDHPLSDVRGYAYEHRLVASEKIGRLLLDNEQVHHINHNKQDNRPENLEVLTPSQHRFAHRTKKSCLKLPGEENVLISCACGCGQTFWRYDASGRRREYISGHNTDKINPQEILDFLGKEAKTLKEIAFGLEWSVTSLYKIMQSLKKDGKIIVIKRYKYCQSEYASIHLSNPLVFCACGCGEQFPQHDKYGRLRKYKSGHNPTKNTK
jgi:hypothetical protein